MTTQEIANGVIELCRQGKYDDCYKTYFAPDAESIEAMPNAPVTKGLDALLEKGANWAKVTEVHASEVEGPLVAGNHFALTFKLDSTNKESGQRTKMEEVAVYHVQNGKVAKEQFFYDM
jgi:ketosteroid isomerase-like protein